MDSSTTNDHRGESGRLAVGVLAAVLLLTSIGGIAISLWYPDGTDGDRYSYSQIQDIQSAWWGWHIFAGVNIVLGVCASALAGWLLVRSRGAILSIVGGSVMCLGAALYGVGLGSLASVFYFTVEPAALDTADGEKLLDYAQDHFARLYGPLLAGAILVALGTIILAVALWRARTVPRWVPILLATVPVTFVAANGIIGVLAALPLTIGTVALGWYAFVGVEPTEQLRAAPESLRPNAESRGEQS